MADSSDFGTPLPLAVCGLRVKRLAQICSEAHAVIFKILISFVRVGAHRKLSAIETREILLRRTAALFVVLALESNRVRRVATQEVFERGQAA